MEEETMKRYIKSSESDNFTNADIVNMLNDAGIDTTKAQYELRAQEYDRYESGANYTKKFTCPGDWLAYWSMLLHKCPNATNFQDHGYELDELAEYIEDNPTVEDMNELASSNWWGDGDDYIIYLKNLTTGHYLYGPEEIVEEFEEEDWED